MSGRPLDVLEEALDVTVTVRLKDGSARLGVLSGYDQHMNVVLEPTDGTEPVESAPGQADAVAVEDTTIIRGDNVVSVDL